MPVASVARRLGVAPSTLRTWDRRYGLGPSGHTDGRHRRYGPADIARLELMQRALLRGASTAEAARYALDQVPRSADAPPDEPIEPPPEEQVHPEHTLTARTSLRIEVADGEVVLPTGDDQVPQPRTEAQGTSRLARGLSAASLAMDVRAVTRLLEEAIETKGVLTAWSQVIEPVLTALAARWRSRRSGAEVEYLLAEYVFAALARATPVRVDARNERPLLLGCAPQERDSLPMYALGAALAERRILTQLFGVPLPRDVLAAAVGQSMPAAVILWAQRPGVTDPHLFTRLARGRQRCRWFACGPGWDRSELPSTVELLDDLSAAVDRLEFVLFGRRVASSLRSE
ncbi:MerR family transcriptional regulator [Amycolatopsis antarctica]|uniref:MerR family transcriptional regulator n=1 Tax=Amycolatopsis antarctica TaxID=1854586 RepID=A0A263D9W0_9PSEU|nr:MerR family transcriptional regulator [Amycolatopsis antarctica]OZM75280.1 MerR family transcriptional regulator [Amycolatopsis antarctica]